MRQTNHTYSQSITRLIHSPSHVFTVNHIVLLAFNIAATTLEDVHPRRNLRPPITTKLWVCGEQDHARALRAVQFVLSRSQYASSQDGAAAGQPSDRRAQCPADRERRRRQCRPAGPERRLADVRGRGVARVEDDRDAQRLAKQRGVADRKRHDHQRVEEVDGVRGRAELGGEAGARRRTLL